MASVKAIPHSLFPRITSLPTINPLKHLLFTSHHQTQKRSFALGASASGLALPINVDYFQREFSSHGVSFKEIGDSCVVKMGLENGSVASLILPDGLITSYKPFMWYGATSEVLHTSVSEGENGEIVVQGGVSMDLTCVGDGVESWTSNKWALLDVKGSRDQSIKVELISIGAKNVVEARCVVTLQEDLLGSEITITNQRPSSLQLSGSVISHLTVSTPDATYAIGLQGSTYRNKEPMVTDFSIIPPNLIEEKPLSFQPLAYKGFDALFSTSNKRGRVHEVESTEEGEEDDDYAQMTEKMCRIYTHAPRELTIIDRVTNFSINSSR